jgi:beta-1,4-mannosyl-glycoprotein beta-1,4-N-acetylglucosaminyltransferase
MKTFDCFTFFNEKEILKTRLKEMNNFIDFFVIVESSQTFTGKQKPFYLDETIDSIEEYSDKIIRVKISFPNNEMTSWEREHYQRNQISAGLREADAKGRDLVIISDVDEIISSKFLSQKYKPKNPIKLNVTQYFWNFNWQVPQHCNQGSRPVMCLYKHLLKNTPQQLREMQLSYLEDCGWHLSFFSNAENVKKKIESFSHIEYDTEEFKSLFNILTRMTNGIDPFDRFPLKYTEVDDSFPIFESK